MIAVSGAQAAHAAGHVWQLPPDYEGTGLEQLIITRAAMRAACHIQHTALACTLDWAASICVLAPGLTC